MYESLKMLKEQDIPDILALSQVPACCCGMKM